MTTEKIMKLADEYAQFYLEGYLTAESDLHTPIREKLLAAVEELAKSAPAAEEAPESNCVEFDGIKQQPATHGEPVAWMWKDGTLTSDPDRADGTWTALYTFPQPTPDHIKAMQQALEWIKFYLGEPNILSPFVGARQCADDLHAALQSALKGTT